MTPAPHHLTCVVGHTQDAVSAPDLARELIESGLEVSIILDGKARRFVGPLSFPPGCTVSGEVPSGGDAGSGSATILFACDSGTIAALANGMYRGISSATRMYVFPALDEGTAAHPAVRANLDALQGDGVTVVEGEFGEVASPSEAVAAVFGGIGRETGEMRGMKLLVTAGGTHENIDSVRFIGNRSSGKMGLAVAREAHRMRAEVTVVAANIPQREPGVEWVPVESVEDMKREVMGRVGGVDAIVMAAAVSDFTPASRLEGKIRRGDSRTMELRLEATSDILGSLRGEGVGERNPGLYVVGFAATHGNPVPDAREKLEKKRADLIIGNDISRSGIGFSSDDNEVHIVGRGVERFVPRAAKGAVARVILGVMSEEMAKTRHRRSD